MNIDTQYVLLNKSVRFILNIVLLYLFILCIDTTNLSQTQTILLICMGSSVILYINDFYFPQCSINIEQKK